MIGDDPWPSFTAYSDETPCAEYLSAHDICVSLPLIKNLFVSHKKLWTAVLDTGMWALHNSLGDLYEDQRSTIRVNETGSLY